MRKKNTKPYPLNALDDVAEFLGYPAPEEWPYPVDEGLEARFGQALGLIKPAWAEALRLYYKDGRTLREMSDQLGKSKEVCRQRIRSGLRAMSRTAPMHILLQDPLPDNEDLAMELLPDRIGNILKRAGYHKLSELAMLTREQALALRNMGQKNIAPVEEAMSMCGLKFRDEPLPLRCTDQDSIGSCGMSPRVANTLWRRGIRTVDGLAGKSDEDLLALRGIGPDAVKEIRRVLKNRRMDKTE